MRAARVRARGVSAPDPCLGPTRVYGAPALVQPRVRQLEQQACMILRRSMLDLHVDGY